MKWRTGMACLLALVVAGGLAKASPPDADAFATMEQRFFSQAFGGDTGRVELSGTHTFVYQRQEPGDGFIPSLYIKNQESVTPSEEGMRLAVQSMVESAQYLQGQFPDAFLFNREKALAGEGGSLGIALAEPDIWLWAQDERSVVFPMYFHRQGEGSLPVQVCMVSAVNQSDGSSYYALYTDGDYLRQYLRLQPLDAEASHFQMATLYWFIQQHAK